MALDGANVLAVAIGGRLVTLNKSIWYDECGEESDATQRMLGLEFHPVTPRRLSADLYLTRYERRVAQPLRVGAITHRSTAPYERSVERHPATVTPGLARLDH